MHVHLDYCACDVDAFPAKRYVLITNDTTIEHVVVEAVPSELTVTAADKVLAFV